jgi:hypothetical protein
LRPSGGSRPDAALMGSSLDEVAAAEFAGDSRMPDGHRIAGRDIGKRVRAR